jgi:hypothetical protein
MSELTPCPECQRHVRTTESRCPFCDSALSLSHIAMPVLPRSRLGRAATFAFGATLASAALVGCGGESESKKQSGGSGSAAGGNATGGSSTAGTASGGSAGNDTGGASSFGGVGLLYGAPAAGSGDFGGNVGVPPK